MNSRLNIVSHIAYYIGLCLLVSFALSLVYSHLPSPFGELLQGVSVVILGLSLPVGSEKNL